MKMFHSHGSKCSSKYSRIVAVITMTLPWLVECWSFNRTRDAALHNATLLHHLYEILASALDGFTEKTCPRVRWGKKEY